MLRWTDVPRGYSESDAREWLRLIETERERARGVYLAVVEANGGALLGTCDVRMLGDGVGELGFFLGRHARGRGAMTRAVRLISRWSVEQLGVARVQILFHPDNVASHRVAERAGFTREGLLRGYRLKGGRREDRVVFSLLAGELDP